MLWICSMCILIPPYPSFATLPEASENIRLAANGAVFSAPSESGFSSGVRTDTSASVSDSVIQYVRKPHSGSMACCKTALETRLYEYIMGDGNHGIHAILELDTPNTASHNWFTYAVNKFLGRQRLVIVGGTLDVGDRRDSNRQLNPADFRSLEIDAMLKLYDFSAVDPSSADTAASDAQNPFIRSVSPSKDSSSVDHISTRRQFFYENMLFLSDRCEQSESGSSGHTTITGLIDQLSSGPLPGQPEDILTDRRGWYDPFRMIFPQIEQYRNIEEKYEPPKYIPTPLPLSDVVFWTSDTNERMTFADFDDIVYKEYPDSGGFALIEGTIPANSAYIANTRDGSLSHEGGSIQLSGDMYLAYNAGTKGAYTLSGGTTSVQNLIVGVEGNGYCNITGGQMTVQDGLILGLQSGSEGSLVLKNKSSPATYTDYFYYIENKCAEKMPYTLRSFYGAIGNGGNGSFVQWNGTSYITYWLGVGYAGGTGTYTMGNAFTKKADRTMMLLSEITRVGANGGQGAFTQWCGTNSSSFLYVGVDSGSGVYNQHGGKLFSVATEVGSNGTGVYSHTGGTHETGELLVGKNAGWSGTYNLTSTTRKKSFLSSDWSTIGYKGGTGVFTHAGQAEHATKHLQIGAGAPGSSGSYTMSDYAKLTAGSVRIGVDGALGSLNITSADTEIAISRTWIEQELQKDYGSSNYPSPDVKLEFGAGSIFSSVAGVSITFDGANVVNNSTNSTDLSGLNTIHFVFAGGINTMEVADADLGAAGACFDTNFAVDVLELAFDSQLADGRNFTYLMLKDVFDNTIDTDLAELSATEALYVNQIIIGKNTILDLRNVNVYYKELVNEGGTIRSRGGQLIQCEEPVNQFMTTPAQMPMAVPEPSAMLLMILGVIVMRPFRSRKQ